MTSTADPGAAPTAPTSPDELPDRGHADRTPRAGGGRTWAVREVRWAAAAAVLFALGGLTHLSGLPAFLWWPLYLACYVAGGWQPAAAGLRALRGRVLDVDLLMVVAAVAAASIGQIFDGALLVVIFASSGALEAIATARTADAVHALLDLAPEQASRIRPDGTEETVHTTALRVDDLIHIRPGERVGADALVVDGASDVDQATLTGEPLPVAKRPGDEVLAGTLNSTGALTARVQRPAEQSVIARIVALIDEATATKASRQLSIEKIEQRYSLVVVAATVALFALPLLAGAVLEPTLLRAMTFMIVASPCAVVLATMPPLLSTIALAGRHGVLVKSAVVLEQLADIDTVAFDKTGTLTEGTPRLIAVHPTTRRPAEAAGSHADRLLRLAAGAEQPSEHPLATAVLTAARDRGLPIPTASDFTSTPGHGVTATIDGHRIRIGSPTLLDGPPAIPDQKGVHDGDRSDVHATVRAAHAHGHTAIVMLIDDQPAGVLTFTDRTRPEATTIVTALTRLTGTPPALLTGDNPAAAHQLADQLGIHDVHANLLPAEKVCRIRTLRDTRQRVLLVGDGVNDAPALAAADIGVAMGRHGSDLALQAADIVLIQDDLTALPTLITLARRARRLVRANLLIAATVITALVTWDLLGDLPLPLGVAGHEGSTILVALNGLRLLPSRTWRAARRQALDNAAPAATSSTPTIPRCI